MAWIFLSILAAFLWAICYILDKYVLVNWIKNPFVPTIVLGLIGFIASVLVFFIRDFSHLAPFNIFLSVLAGIIWVLGAVLYFQAIKIEEISRIVPLHYLSPIIILVLAGIFLGEVFTVGNYAGISLIIIGAILISSKSLSKIVIGKAFWFMISYIFLFSCSAVLMKYLLNFADFWTIFAYMRIGAIIGLIPIIIIYFSELVKTVKQFGKRIFFVMSLSESLNLGAILAVGAAASVGYITLVSAISSIDAFFVLLFTIILSLFFPHILKEEISRLVLTQKFIAIAIMFIGTILII